MNCPFWLELYGCVVLHWRGRTPDWSVIVGFAIGVQQLHPTLVQRTYG